MRMITCALLAIASAALFGCAAGRPQISIANAGAGADASALEGAVEAYFAAENAAGMKEAVARAEKLAPDSAEYHFIAADLAYYDDEQEAQFEHLYQAVRDTESSVARAALMEFWNLPWSDAQQRAALPLLEKLAEAHPDPAVRAFAAFAAFNQLRDVGELARSRGYLDRVGWRLPLATIGTWDNSQGKSFDISFEPESEIDFSAKYAAKTVDAAWRPAPPLDAFGAIDFTEILYPTSWVVAYAFADFECAAPGTYELRVTSTDDLKIWVNGRLVFSDRNITGASFDGIVVPLELGRGENRILFKTAQDGDASWSLLARMTGEGGAPVADGTFAPAPRVETVRQPVYESGEPMSLADAIEPRVRGFEEGSAARAYFVAYWAALLGLDTLSVQAADAFRQAYPNSFSANYALAMILWDKQERSKANLYLRALFEKHSGEFLQIRLKQARFWQQSSLRRKARALLVSLTEEHPESREALYELASWYDDEDWEEDRCAILERVHGAWPEWRRSAYELASCYSEFNFDDKIEKLYRGIVANHPYELAAQLALFDYAVEALDFDTADGILGTLLEAWPTDTTLWTKRAYLEMWRGDFDASRAAIAHVREMIPDSPAPFNLLASLAYQEKKPDAAIALWKDSLKRDPEDSDLEERLSYLSPEEPEPWQVDAPTEDDIAAAIASRETVAREPGASMALLLDHKVTKLNIDGSAVSIITSVNHAYDQDGRDALITNYIGCAGRVKVLHAYSVSPAGERTEATDVDGKKVLFRGLEVGATTAVQARCEEAPNSLIGDYYSEGWSFQGFRQQFVDSRIVLWSPKGTKLLEYVRGEIAKETSERGDYVRTSWAAKSAPTLTAEPNMPPGRDIRWTLQLSTIPDWGMFFKWEDALLHEATRRSPEIEALAAKLFEKAATKEERLNKIQAYLTTEIRYKREYENAIAGVKPHPAPVVIARGYGDCKDKSVLFIALAKLAGIDIRYALVRTRDSGEILREVPSQQFNHAIVYIPAQDGIAEPRFVDPTADGWDVDVLRTDDPGTWSLVSDLDKKTFEWIRIPFQGVEKNAFATEIDLVLSESGAASGKLTMSSKGGTAAALRIVSRDSERFSDLLQSVADQYMTGATVVPPREIDLEDVEKTVRLEIEVKTDTFARKDGRELVFDVPVDAKPEKMFVLEKRTFPLVMPAPQMSTLDTRIALPKRSKIVKAPGDVSMSTPCITYSRRVEKKGEVLIVHQELRYDCERISPEEYADYRGKIQVLRKSLEENVTVKLAK